MNDLDVLAQQAVDAAINQKWKDALSFNEKIVKLDSKNLAATLRLGYAYLQLKNNKEAKKYYQKALRIQPKNHVALENLERISVLGMRRSKKTADDHGALNPALFLEIPGKTKSISLVNVGQKKDLAELRIGQEMILQLKKRKVEARTKSDKYIGSLPDDLSKRLIFFLKAKSKYLAYVKEASLNRVVMFIKEESKGKKVANFLSFPQNSQSNMDKISDESQPAAGDEDDTEEDEWEGVGHELAHEEKEEHLVDIHHEEEEVEE